jgi:hypothetical protein
MYTFQRIVLAKLKDDVEFAVEIEDLYDPHHVGVVGGPSSAQPYRCI